MKYTKQELEEDVFFLANRASAANKVSFLDSARDTGGSSNSIVSIAYGVLDFKNRCLPSDSSDLRSCENMWLKLPEHRKTGDAGKAMEEARNSKYFGKHKLMA